MISGTCIKWKIEKFNMFSSYPILYSLKRMTGEMDPHLRIISTEDCYSIEYSLWLKKLTQSLDYNIHLTLESGTNIVGDMLKYPCLPEKTDFCESNRNRNEILTLIRISLSSEARYLELQDYITLSHNTSSTQFVSVQTTNEYLSFGPEQQNDLTAVYTPIISTSPSIHVLDSHDQETPTSKINLRFECSSILGPFIKVDYGPLLNAVIPAPSSMRFKKIVLNNDPAIQSEKYDESQSQKEKYSVWTESNDSDMLDFALASFKLFTANGTCSAPAVLEFIPYLKLKVNSCIYHPSRGAYYCCCISLSLY